MINPPIYRLTTAVSDIDQTNINRDIRDGNWLSSATPSPLPAVNLVIIPSALTLFLYLECCIVVVFGLSNHSFLLQGMGKVAVGSRQ